jgi:hypothetical protein
MKIIIVAQEFINSYCERGAIPLAFPKWCPATTTGIPWFPAAIEAMFLFITDTSEWTIWLTQIKEWSKSKITHVPCPSPSKGEALSSVESNIPLVIADAAKWRAPTSFLLHEPDGKSGVTSQVPQNRAGALNGCSDLSSAKLGCLGSMPVSTNAIVIPSPAVSNPPDWNQAPCGRPKNCGVCVVAVLTEKSKTTLDTSLLLDSLSAFISDFKIKHFIKLHISFTV